MATSEAARRTGVVAGPARSQTTGTAAPARRHGGGGLAPWLFLAPYLVLFLGFVIAPIVYGLWISLHDYDYTLPGKPFVGFDNYVKLVDPSSTTFSNFWAAMRATGIFTLFSVPLLLVLPLLVALVMNGRFRGRNLFRALYFAPYVLGVAVVAVIWRFLLDANIGIVNQYLGDLGLPKAIPWLTSTPQAWVALVGVTVWWTLGFNAVIYLAGLQEISAELYEAARVDGANRWQSFWNVTFPGLRPVVSFVTMVTIIASANMFGQSYLMTRGGPGVETRTAIGFIAETGLTSYQMGDAAAMSYVLTVVLMLLSVVVFRAFREREA